MTSNINKIQNKYQEKNLTAYAGLNPIFQYLDSNLNIFSLLQEKITLDKKKRDYTLTDYFKILFAFFIIGYERLQHILLIANDNFILKLLQIEKIVRPENIVRCFLSKFTFKYCYQISQLNAFLFKRKHAELLSVEIGNYCIVDCDSTPRDASGNQEGTGIHYKKHNGYHPLLAFIYETKEFLNGYLRPGQTYTGNGVVEFMQENLERLGPSIKKVMFRADSGFFNAELMDFLETKGHDYLIKAKLYSTLSRRISEIPEEAYYNLSDNWNNNCKVTCIHYKLPNWNTTRKFIILRIPEKENQQLKLDGNQDIQYNYQVYCTNLLLSAEKIIELYKQRGNSENYLKEIKQDLNMEKTTFQCFWQNEAFFQLMMLVYNCLLWYKAELISLQEAVHERIYTFRLKYLFVAGKLKKSGRKYYLDIQENFKYKKLFELSYQLFSSG